MKLRVEHRLLVDDEHWEFGRRILDARRIGDCVVIIFDYMEFPKPQQARNLMAYDLSRNLLWVAEHPTDGQTDTYVHITSETPLRASNFASYICDIDIETGRLLNAVFTK